jgi:hypothetical protein
MVESIGLGGPKLNDRIFLCTCPGDSTPVKPGTVDIPMQNYRGLYTCHSLQ